MEGFNGMKHCGPPLKISPKKRVYTEEQKERSREAQRKRRAKNPERVRELGRASEKRRRYRRYGISEEGYNVLWETQEKCCAICKTKENSSLRAWHVDHCHENGKVRGILCHHCNLLLGNARDNTNILEQAIQYLENRH